LLISYKIEQLNIPNILDFVNICKGIYSKQQILETEGIIAQTLAFNFNFPSSAIFLEIYLTWYQSNYIFLNE